MCSDEKERGREGGRKWGGERDLAILCKRTSMSSYGNLFAIQNYFICSFKNAFWFTLLTNYRKEQW